MFGIGGGHAWNAAESQEKRSSEAEREVGAESNTAAARIDLTSAPDGEAAVVVGFSGGAAEVGRLESMGIRAGALIRKKSAALNQGPVVIERGSSQLALAYGIARGILVEPLR